LTSHLDLSQKRILVLQDAMEELREEEETTNCLLPTFTLLVKVISYYYRSVVVQSVFIRFPD
jgi:hypothetical protein